MQATKAPEPSSKETAQVKTNRQQKQNSKCISIISPQQLIDYKGQGWTCKSHNCAEA